MSVNRVILIGNVGQDPRVKYFDTGSAVATFPLATTDRGYTLQNGTQIPERTEWHNIVASNRLAEIVDKYQPGAHAKTAGVLQADEASL